MRNILIAAIHRLPALAFLALTLNLQPVLAQTAGNLPDNVTATYSARLARYYAPYALQAAAAYMDVATLNATLDPSSQPGSDVTVAANYVVKDQTLVEKATKYLRSWRYQFGSEGYLTCFENDPDCLNAIRKDRWTFAISGGPSFHVWARTRFPQKEGTACSEVSIAFRGTDLSRGVGSGVADVLSNLDQVTGYVADDHYRQLRRNIDAIIKKITTLPCYKAGNRPQIVSVGHSLGAGLGQFAALANNPSRPNRITKVFAFDPSPVTGASYLDKSVRLQNAEGLEIDRIYQSGEFLQPARRLLQQFPPSTAPCVRTVVFDASRGTSLQLHSMATLASGMVDASYWDDKQNAYLVPERLPRCRSRYVAPATDEDNAPAPQGPLVSSLGAPAARVTSADRARAMNSFAMSGGSGFESAPLTEMVGSVASAPAKKPDAPRSKRAAAPQAPALQVAAAWPPG